MFSLIKKYGYELDEEYITLFIGIFGEMDHRQLPGLVYFGYEDNKCVGFASGYMLNFTDFYIQYFGAIPEIRGTGKVFDYLMLSLQELDKEFRGIAFSVKNDNIIMIKLALNIGFTINGTHQDSGGNLYVDFIRSNKNG